MIFRVIDIETEPLQPDQVVDRLPDHAAYWHRAHDSQQDDDGIAVDVHTRSFKALTICARACRAESPRSAD